MNARKKIISAVFGAVLLALTVWTVWGNTALVLTEYTVQDPNIPAAFDGFRIAQVSDLHNGEIGKENTALLSMLRETRPDMIAITGDLIDSRCTDLEVALAFAREAVKIAPCYYVTGNHESRMEEEYAQLKAGLLEMGVTVLEDTAVTLERSGASIDIAGIQDPAFETDYVRILEVDLMEESLQKVVREDGFMIVLSHRPDYMDLYVKHRVDLVLTGHAHGGQVRLPLVGGLYAPNQGLFPKYDAGVFREGNTQMVVSRGIGNSAFPFRINNRPEVVLITLKQ